MTLSHHPGQLITRQPFQSGALARIDEAAEFQFPASLRCEVAARFATAIYHQLPIAAFTRDGSGGSRGRDAYLHLAAQSQDALAVVTCQFQAFLRQVVRSGIRVQYAIRGEPRTRIEEQVMGHLEELVPGVPSFGIRAMPLEELAAAAPDPVRRHYVAAAWETAKWTAEKYVEAVEELFRLMVVGAIEVVGDGAARVVFGRGVVKGTGRKNRLHSPTPYATHPLYEDADKVVVKVFELVNAVSADHASVWASTPQRVQNLLAAVPPWLGREVSGVTGKLVRAGHGQIKPADLSRSTTESIAFQTFSCVVLAKHFVLGEWKADECPSLLRQLFGIGE